jgi:hypothetical protein
MASERLQRHIERLLDEADQAIKDKLSQGTTAKSQQ